MPASKKVSWAQLRVGIMAVVAMVILAVLIFLLTSGGGVFTRHATLKTFMDDSAAMATGSPVRLNGILIGTIEEIRLTGSKEPGKVVEIDMSVKRQFLPEIPVDSVAGVSAANLLGDKFINITKGQSPQHVQDGGTIKSLQGQDIPELLKQSADILTAFQVTLKRLDNIIGGIEAGEGNVGKFLKDEELYNRLTATAAEAQKVIAVVNSGKGTLGRLVYDDSLYEEIRGPIKRIDDMLAELQQGRGTAGKLMKDPALYDDTQKSIAEVRQIIEGIKGGKGTVGKLLKDEELYGQLNQIVAKLNGTVDKMNSGQGTLGQLVVNPQLYESLNSTTRELNALVKDIRANPRKFLRLKLALF